MPEFTEDGYEVVKKVPNKDAWEEFLQYADWVASEKDVTVDQAAKDFGYNDPGEWFRSYMNPDEELIDSADDYTDDNDETGLPPLPE